MDGPAFVFIGTMLTGVSAIALYIGIAMIRYGFQH